jgi:hypothetical protein
MQFSVAEIIDHHIAVALSQFHPILVLAAENGGTYVDTLHGPGGVGAVAAAVSNGRPSLAHAFSIGKK